MLAADHNGTTHEKSSTYGSGDGDQLDMSGEQVALGLLDIMRVNQIGMSRLSPVVAVDIVDIVLLESLLRERHFGCVSVLRWERH
jgi:hypothetical protein